MDTLTPDSRDPRRLPRPAALLARQTRLQPARVVTGGGRVSASAWRVSACRSGRARPSREMVLALADRLGVPLPAAQPPAAGRRVSRGLQRARAGRAHV
ncbi:hypothetical protein ACU4GD_18485 [Cupriavidus basilensis]